MKIAMMTVMSSGECQEVAEWNGEQLLSQYFACGLPFICCLDNKKVVPLQNCHISFHF